MHKHILDPKDGGIRSRKFLLVIWTIHLMVALGLMTIHWQVLGTYLQIIYTAILGALGLYFTSNIAHKVTVAKTVQPPAVEPVEGAPTEGD
jgi:hypothetical protein